MTRTVDKGVCAIIVSFEPDVTQLINLYRRLATQCQVVIVDNGSASDTIAELRRNLPDDDHHLSLLAENVGIAAAQNAGVDHASRRLAQRPEYLLFLDQDSVPPEDFVSALRSQYESVRRRDAKIAALGPALIDPRNQAVQPLHHERMGFYWKRQLSREDPGENYRVASVNSSGTFMELATFEHVGKFRADLFIDHVDTEWSYRARHLGYSLYVSSRVAMEHEMGRGLENVWVFGDRAFPSRAPLRHYYLFRNNVYLLSQPQMTRTWKFWSLIKLLFTLSYFGIVSADRKAQRSMMLSGIRAGWSGRLGKYSSAS